MEGRGTWSCLSVVSASGKAWHSHWRPSSKWRGVALAVVGRARVTSAERGVASLVPRLFAVGEKESLVIHCLCMRQIFAGQTTNKKRAWE